MSILAKAGSLLKRFRLAQEGQVALTLALTVTPIFLFAGGSIDYIRSSGVHERLQYALDAAALAAASSKNLPERDRLRLAKEVFDNNWKSDGSTRKLTATARFDVQGDAIKGKASVKVPTAFTRIIKINSFDIEAKVSIGIPKAKKAEVALVLDYSGSMTETSGGKVKYVAMRDAAKKLVDELSQEAPGQVKIGLVPFSQQVRVTLPKKFVAGQGNAAGDWTGCTVDRQAPHNTTDDAPVLANEKSKWGHPVPIGVNPDCAPYVSRSLNVRPLTDDFESINRQLDAMRPFNLTHVALGAEFGWHLLSPSEPFGQGAQYDDKGTQKIMIVLSDGRQTVPGFGRGGRRDEDAANENFLSICGNAHRNGIRVITIAFDMAADREAQARMRSCASDPKKDYYEPDSGDDVAKVFDDIRTRIASTVFVSQ